MSSKIEKELGLDKTKFYYTIKELCKEHKLDISEGILLFCKYHGIEPHEIVPLINAKLKSLLADEYFGPAFPE